MWHISVTSRTQGYMIRVWLGSCNALFSKKMYQMKFLFLVNPNPNVSKELQLRLLEKQLMGKKPIIFPKNGSTIEKMLYT